MVALRGALIPSFFLTTFDDNTIRKSCSPVAASLVEGSFLGILMKSTPKPKKCPTIITTIKIRHRRIIKYIREERSCMRFIFFYRDDFIIQRTLIFYKFCIVSVL